MKDLKTSNGLWVHLALLSVTFLWGFNNLALKYGFRFVDPLLFNGLRLLVVLPFLIYYSFYGPGSVKFTWSDYWRLGLLGGAGLGLFQILFPLGISQTSTPIGGILMATMPIHVALLSTIFKLEKRSWKVLAGALLSILGLFLIAHSSTLPSDAGRTTLRGILFVVIAEFGYAVNTTFVKPFLKRYSAMQVTSVTLCTSSIVFLVYAFPTMVSSDYGQMKINLWLTALYSGWIGLLFSNIIWNRMINRIGSSRVAIYGNLLPVNVLILSAIFFGELLIPLQVLGAAIILIAVVIVQLPSRAPKEESEKVPPA